jgi:hypothetical protein
MKKLDTESVQDEWYANTQARINTVVGEYSEDWRAIKLARHVWWKESNDESVRIIQSFEVWAEDRYGIRIKRDLESMGYDPKFEIVDESKYIIFLLKYK